MNEIIRSIKKNLHVRDAALRHHLSGQCAAKTIRRSKVRRKVEIPRGRPKKKRGKQSSRHQAQEHIATHFDDIWDVILDYIDLKKRHVKQHAGKNTEPRPLTIYTADIGKVTGIELLKIRHVINILAAMNVFERPSKSLGFLHTFPVIYLGLDRMKKMIQELQHLILEYPHQSEDDVFQHWMDIMATHVHDNRKWPSIRRLTLKMLIHIMAMRTLELQRHDEHHVVTISSLKVKCPIPCFHEVIILLVHFRIIHVVTSSGYQYESRPHALYANTDVIKMNPDIIDSSFSPECSYQEEDNFRSPAHSIGSSTMELTPPPPPTPPLSIERKCSLKIRANRMDLQLPPEIHREKDTVNGHSPSAIAFETRGEVKRQVLLDLPPRIQRTPAMKTCVSSKFDSPPGTYTDHHLPEQDSLVDCTFYDLVQEFIPRERSSSLSLANSNPLESPENGLMMSVPNQNDHPVSVDSSEEETNAPVHLSSWLTHDVQMWSPENEHTSDSINCQEQHQLVELECHEQLLEDQHVIVFTPPPPAPKLRPTPKLLFDSNGFNSQPRRSTIRVIGGQYFGLHIKTPPKYPSGRLFWTYRKDPPLDSRMWWNDTFNAFFIQAMPSTVSAPTKEPEINSHHPTLNAQDEDDSSPSTTMPQSSHCLDTDVYFARSPCHQL